MMRTNFCASSRGPSAHHLPSCRRRCPLKRPNWVLPGRAGGSVPKTPCAAIFWVAAPCTGIFWGQFARTFAMAVAFGKLREAKIQGSGGVERARQVFVQLNLVVPEAFAASPRRGRRPLPSWSRLWLAATAHMQQPLRCQHVPGSLVPRRSLWILSSPAAAPPRVRSWSG